MSETIANSKLFEDVIGPLLEQGLSVRFQACGASMSPAIRDGEFVEVTPVIVSKLRKDDIVLAKSHCGFRLHRIVLADAAKDVFITRGDCGQQDDPELKASQILGLARAKEVRVGRNVVQARFRSMGGWMLRSAARAQYICGKVLKKSAGSISSTNISAILLSIFFLIAAASVHAQVAVDSVTSGSAELTGGFGGTATLPNIAHTTTATGTNLLMVVGVSIDISNSAATTVNRVRWNTTNLTFLGAHNDAGNTRRVEVWYLLAPATGTNNVSVRINVPNGTTVGVAAGVTTFTGVDQTVPLGAFTSADGAGGANSQEDVPGVINGMIIDTLAIGGAQTAAVQGPQVQQWNLNTGGSDTTDVTATGSTRSGAPSVPIAETFSGAENWSLGAVSVNPTAADIGVTTNVSAVAFGQNSTYNITVTNNGPSTANAVVLTDTLAAGLTLVSVTPSAGTTCTGTGPITCTLPATLASGATATVAVVVKASAAGFYPNTASVTDSGTPPDPNTGNNTYVGVAPVVATVCATGTPPAGGTLSGVLNTYYPGTASVAAGATSIPVGVANGTGTIAAGSELLVIQMQDASISISNTVAYGNGSTGTGFTVINNAGNYEFVTATGPVSGGSVPILGAGLGGGLVFGYTAAAASATKGQSTYQVVLVPQYTTATLGAATAAAWNGSTGGILALDIGSNLNLGSATVSVNGLGFRGGAGMQLVGGYGGANTDYQYKSPTAYTGAAGGVTGVDASKGEGVAGTPEWVESGGTFLQTTTTVGYPSGTAGTDGSMARGAPGNAGAGGTDANSAANDQNAGGGGGGNGGTGGFGGDSWNTNLSDGGEGGSPFPATIDRIAMGGGGGAGTRNNSDTDNQASSGAAGGGIVFIRAFSFSGTATITANGSASYNGTKNDAGGGGGAGGTIIMLAASGGEGGLTLQANGGRGGDAWDAEAYALGERHGPGGGGAGGVILVSGTPASVSVVGGANGTTLTPGVAYGATPGKAGTSAVTATMSQVTGLQSSEVCTRLPDFAITKSHGGVTFIRGTTATFTLALSNVSPLGASSGVVTVDDTLPLGMAPTTAAGVGWTCSVSGQTISCTRSDALAAGGSYGSITVTGNVLQSAPATLTNTGVVSGGGDVSPLNDTSTDTANVASTADMSVTDAGSPNPVASGGTITYTIGVTDNGPSAADNATLVAAVPANTTFVSLTAPAGWSCLTPAQNNTGTAVCTNANLAALTTGTFTMVVKVNTGVANGTVINGTAQVGSSVSDPNSANNTASVNTIVGTSGPNLSVTNVAAPNPVQAGSQITYTQIVTNTGSSAITNGTFSEGIPANTTFVSITPAPGWTCTGFPGVPCSATTVAAGASGTFTVVYAVIGGTAAGTIITDTATVNATNQSFGANSATATDVVATAAQADVVLATAATPNPVIAGNNITYTQTITNDGPAASAGVSFSEVTPGTTTFESVLAPPGWTCTTPAVGTAGTVTCSDPSNLASGATANIIVVVNVPSTAAQGNMTAISSVTATTSDPNSSNNSTTVTTYINNNCDLAVTNAGAPNPVAVGATIVYTQIVTNNGPASCSAGTLTEPTPANTTFVSVGAVTSGGGTWTCNATAPVSCSNPSVPPGSTGTITATFRVNAGATGNITDTVTVGTTTKDTNSSNNSATVVTSITTAGDADLSITNSGSPTSVAAGNNITYTQTVTNAGPAAAVTPKVVETPPAGTTAISLTGPTGWTCVLGTLTCTDTGNLAATTTTTAFTLVVTVPSTAAAGSITETATVSSPTTPDPNGANNSATVTSFVTDSADLSVTNSASPIGVVAGNNITYTQQVTNAGPSTATSVSLTETLPANTTVISLTGPAGWTCTPATRTCTNPSLAPGALAATITYTLQVTAGTPAGTAISETATVSSSVTDPNQANNTATANDIVALATQANIVTTNVAVPTSVQAGNNVTYTQTVTNSGPAVANGASITETTPPNTTFQSMTPPAGWTCGTLPAVGGTGTITCTDGSNLAVGAGSGNFSLVLQVNSSTPSGTSITDTATGNDTNPVPSMTTNTASATVIVGNASSSTLVITKTGSPNPVTEGTPLTYSIAITNSGPANATTVTLTDTLPSSVTYLSSTTTQGSCSEAGGTVTCLLGTMANAGTSTISILTIPNTPGTISNTATVNCDQCATSFSSTWVETVTAPTSVKLLSFSAHAAIDQNGGSRVILLWKTGGEAHNLGFNVYREHNGNRVRMNPSPIAGSALLMSGALAKHAGRTYAWIDSAAGATGASYWLEDIDVNGTRAMHGPISVTAGSAVSEAGASETRMLSQLNQAQPPVPGSRQSHVVEAFGSTPSATDAQRNKQFELAAHPAIKIMVRHEGWYRVTQTDLIKAGLDPNLDPANLHLYAEAIEQPLQVTGATGGPGGFGPGAAISFYGTGINTEFSGTRIYWLVAGDGHGSRITQEAASSGSNQPPANYWTTVELQQHTIYFSALITSTGDNFFGALVSPTPVDQILEVAHLDTASSQSAQLEVSLQGIITAFPHDVAVTLNGTAMGDVIFTGQAQGTLKVSIPAGVLKGGSNTVTLTSQNGDYDTSLVNYIRISYPHRYMADSDQLKFTGRAGDEITVGNFTSTPMVLDITDPNRAVELAPQVTESGSGKYSIALQVPFTTTNPTAATRHTLLAVGQDRIASPDGIWANRPSHWHSAQPGADIAIVTDGEFAGALTPLVHAHKADGKTSAIIPVGELYDEFNFGEHSPFAIKLFLQTAAKKWRTPPTYLLLNGRASLDPRNYLGFGNLDLVPTRIVPTATLMTASDDWFSDFNNTGVPTIATGRLPVSTSDEAKTVVGKIAAYESQSTNGSWSANALFVADKDDTENFTQDSQTVQAMLPSTMEATDLFVDNVGTVAARTDLPTAINSGLGLVNYLGHGSEEQWAGPEILNTTTVSSLTNGSQLPVFLIMDCLNGFFQDVYGQSLGVTLMLAPNGGAVAVLASSGLNQAPPQTTLDAMVVKNAFAPQGMTLGNAIIQAKRQISDPDVRRTFVLLGDPAMQVNLPANP